MILNKLVTTLQFSTDSERHSATKLGRLAFLEWLLSLPDDHNLVIHARNAHARAAMVQSRSLALTVFCGLLFEAAHSPCESPKPARIRSRVRTVAQSNNLVVLH